MSYQSHQRVAQGDGIIAKLIEKRSETQMQDKRGKKGSIGQQYFGH